jgi:hypothetical protein
VRGLAEHPDFEPVLPGARPDARAGAIDEASRELTTSREADRPDSRDRPIRDFAATRKRQTHGRRNQLELCVLNIRAPSPYQLHREGTLWLELRQGLYREYRQDTL